METRLGRVIEESQEVERPVGQPAFGIALSALSEVNDGEPVGCSISNRSNARLAPALICSRYADGAFPTCKT